MNLIRTAIPDVVIVEPQVFEDERGWFMESYNEPAFRTALEKAGLPQPRPFVQDNHSMSHKGVLRGLHYQLPPHAQGKLVRVITGAAFDVAVDLRKNSPTFGKWVGTELSSRNKRQLWIPEGFAHGFMALENTTEVIYKVTDVWSKLCERGIQWDDANLAIEWPGSSKPMVAPKDRAAKAFVQTEFL